MESILSASIIISSFKQTQIAAIQESKIPKKTKVGIIPFVHNFEVSAFIQWNSLPYKYTFIIHNMMHSF